MFKPAAPFNLTVNDQLQLEGWRRTNTLSQHRAQHARILLLLNEGETPQGNSDSLQVSTQMVFKWRERYSEQGLKGLYEVQRPGQRGKLDGKTVKKILEDKVHKVPKEDTHWSIRLLAEHAGHFADKVCNVVELYLNPPDHALVLSVGEKAQIGALDRTQPKLQIRPGQVERRTDGYKRNGTTSLYATFNILTCEVIGRVTQRHRAMEFLDFLRQIDRENQRT